MMSVALIAYVAATIVGMVVGSLAPFWCTIGPIASVSVVAGAVFFFSRLRGGMYDWARFTAVFAGCMWGALAGAFATSTCGPTHARSFLGSDVAAVVVSLVAIALVLVADMLPRAVTSRPHALCGLLFLSTVGLALTIGAEAPSWP
jgi:hypothetical protein